MNKRFKQRPEQTVKRFCRILTAAMLILLLFILSIPSVIALENETNILPDSDIPETFNQINESTPTAGMLHFDSVSGLKQWLATAEGNERYKTVYYDDGSGQNCKDNIDALIKNVRENGILVPYVNGQDAVNMCSIYIPDGKGWPASVYFDTEINGVKYSIGMTYIPQENKQYTQAGYVEYKTAVMGTVYNDEYIEKFGQYIPARIKIGATEYDAALKQSPYNGRNSVYAIIGNGYFLCKRTAKRFLCFLLLSIFKHNHRGDRPDRYSAQDNPQPGIIVQSLVFDCQLSDILKHILLGSVAALCFNGNIPSVNYCINGVSAVIRTLL